VFVGSLTPTAPRATELALTELTAAGFSMEEAAQTVVTTLFYTTGYVIEEQARTGVDYPENPYATDPIDTSRYPLTAEALPVPFNPDADAGFEAGLAIVLDGVRARRLP
jgi:TetR/AcrR family transcriptional regulator, tetracycline repressor protein